MSKQNVERTDVETSIELDNSIIVAMKEQRDTETVVTKENDHSVEKSTTREPSPVLIPTPVRRSKELNGQTSPKKRWAISRLQTIFIAQSCRNWKTRMCV